MANRQFTQANNGNKYCNLKTVFRVGLVHLLWGYVEFLKNGQTNSNKKTSIDNDPFAPKQPETKLDINKNKKVTPKQVFGVTEKKLKMSGYSFFDDVLEDVEYLEILESERFIDFIEINCPDLVDEMKGIIGKNNIISKVETNSGIDI
jgi:hypothetical protein